jgi:hypothetical protein
MRMIILLALLPFLCHSQFFSHSRGAAMGDAGIASATGNQQLTYNTGKAVFSSYMHQASFTFLPWMRQLNQDTKFIRADYLTTTGENSAIGFAFNYLDMGNLTVRDNYGASLAIYRNTAFTTDATVGLRLGEHSGIGSTLHLIGTKSFDGAAGPSNHYGFSGDIHLYQQVGKFSIGAAVNHLGSEAWQPTFAGFGLGYQDRDEMNEWAIAIDFKKPVKAPLQHAQVSVGGEVGFSECLFFRAGLQLERQSAGNRNFLSLGAGYKGFIEDQSCSIDIHYIVPFAHKTALTPLQNAYGITLNLHIRNFQ